MSPCSCFKYPFLLSLKDIYYAYSILLCGWKHELCSNQHKLSICHFPWFRQYLPASRYGSLWVHQVRSHYSSTPCPPTLLRGKAGIQCLKRVTRPSTPSPLRPHPPSLLSSFPQLQPQKTRAGLQPGLLPPQNFCSCGHLCLPMLFSSLITTLTADSLASFMTSFEWCLSGTSPTSCLNLLLPKV